MPQELEVVALTVDLPEYGLRAGDIGSIVLEHGSNGYEVEFTTISGETIAVVSLKEKDVRAIGPGEIACTRRVA